MYRSFVSSPIVSGGFIAFLYFILYDVTGDRFTPHTSRLHCTFLFPASSDAVRDLSPFVL